MITHYLRYKICKYNMVSHWFLTHQKLYVLDDPDLEEFQLEIEESKLQSSVQCTPMPGK